MPIPQAPAQCKLCLNFDLDLQICKLYEELPGEGSRKDVTECASHFDRTQTDDLRVLAEYIDEDKDSLVAQRLNEIINKLLDGYENRFKVMVVGIARRKIKAMVKMVDVIDILLDKLTDIDAVNLTSQQTIRLLSELNTSVNNDLGFIMKLLNPDTSLKDLQVLIDNRSININGASRATEIKAEEILNVTSTSRDKIREAFDALLNNIDVEGVEEVYVPTQEEKEDIETL